MKFDHDGAITGLGTVGVGHEGEGAGTLENGGSHIGTVDEVKQVSNERRTAADPAIEVLHHPARDASGDVGIGGEIYDGLHFIRVVIVRMIA